MRLIDADKLKEIIEKWCPKNKCGENTDEDNYIGEIICDVFKTIDEQPTVEERPIAYWKADKYMIKSPTAENYSCSNCNFHSFSYKYCPHCGAKMIE